MAGLYMVATVGALLCSSHRRIAVFGAANLLALPVLVLTSSRALTSLWCLWAAVASVVIANHQRSAAGTADSSDAPDTAGGGRARSPTRSGGARPRR